MNTDEKIQELEQKIAELTSLIQQGQVQAPAAPAALAAADTTAPVVAEQPRASRRNMLKLAGAAAVGTAAAMATNALPAAADNGLSLANSATATGLNYTGTSATAAFLFQSGTTYNPGLAAFPAALAGWSSLNGTANIPSGIYGYTDQGGYGVVGWGNGTAAIGVLARGKKANMILDAEGTAAPARTGAYALGTLVEDATGSLWVCVVGGAAPTWRKLAGANTSGSLHLISPKRVYDSRPAGAPTDIAPKTALAASTRTIDCTLNSSGVPAGATGLLLNVTAIALSANGFLAVTPGGAGFTGTSTLNWTAAGAVVANSVTVAAGAGAKIDLTVGGGGNADVIVDVFGYYL